MYGKNCKKGIYKPINPGKYNGNSDNIIYRSGLELKYFKYVDTNDKILAWQSEEIVVPYIGLDGKWHRYYTDLWMKVQQTKGGTREFLCEIKPQQFTRPPRTPKRRTKSWNEQYKTWLINSSKWEAAKEYADKNNMQFIFLTEKDI